MKVLSVSVLLVIGFVLGLFHGERKITRIKKLTRTLNHTVKSGVARNNGKLKTALKLQESAVKYCVSEYSKLTEESSESIKILEKNLNSCEERLKNRDYAYQDNLYPEKVNCEKELNKNEGNFENEEIENEEY